MDPLRDRKVPGSDLSHLQFVFDSGTWRQSDPLSAPATAIAVLDMIYRRGLKRIVILKARQIGFSTLLGVICTALSPFMPPSRPVAARSAEALPAATPARSLSAFSKRSSPHSPPARKSTSSWTTSPPTKPSSWIASLPTNVSLHYTPNGLLESRLLDVIAVSLV